MRQPPEDWERLASYVVSARKRAGYETREAFAAAIGVTARTLGKLENGERVSRDTLAAVADGVGWTPDSPRRVLAGGEPEGGRTPARDGQPSPAEGFARQMGVDPSDPDDPFLRSVRRDIAAAVMAHGAGATGAQVFRGHPGSDIEAMLWDAPGLSQEGKEQAIAAMRADRARYEASRPGDASGTAGLARRAAALAAR